MWCPLYINMIVLMFLMMMKLVKTHITDGSFNIVEPGQSIMGRVGSERPARTSIQCSSMCLLDDSCQGYQYKDNRTGLGKCVLIHNDCQNVQSNSSAVTYKKESDRIKPSDESWIPPQCWTGPSAVLYQSFDSSDGLVLMAGSQVASDAVPLVSGKVNNAWAVNRTKSQWVDLGIHTDACMTQPDTCGAAGGAINLWVKVIECGGGGIVSSLQSGSTGSVIYCTSSDIWFRVYLPYGQFNAAETRPTGWFHVVLNYIGPYNGHGIRIYYDGAEVGMGTTKWMRSYPTGDGGVVVGRYYPDRDDQYASVQVDELIYFNASLTSAEVQLIYNSA